MTKKFFLFAVIAAAMVLMTSCIKTEATVDVTVLDQAGKPAAGVTVCRFNNSSSAYYTNSDETHETNAAGVAHFELKTLDDLGPGKYDNEGANFTFRAFDKDQEPASEEATVYVKPGEKKTLTLTLN
jgi:5-hydroxyisourate hydrolase-like protein (transthyretin family)